LCLIFFFLFLIVTFRLLFVSRLCYYAKVINIVMVHYTLNSNHQINIIVVR